MNELETNEKMDAEAVHSKVLRAGRRTYFFDVKGDQSWRLLFDHNRK